MHSNKAFTLIIRYGAISAINSRLGDIQFYRYTICEYMHILEPLDLYEFTDLVTNMYVLFKRSSISKSNLFRIIIFLF